MSDACLVIGVGFLGKVVVQRCSAAGLRLYGTTRKLERFDAIRELGATPVLWDVLCPPAGSNLPRVKTAVYCVSLDTPRSQGTRGEIAQGLKITLEHLAPCRLIFISTTGVYGDHAGGWVDETTPATPCDASGIAHLEAERLLFEIAPKLGIEPVILRLAGIYGPGRIIGGEALRTGAAIGGDPEAPINLIHVEDAASVIDAVRAHANPDNLFVVSDGNPVTRRELYTHTAKILSCPAPNFDAGGFGRQRGARRIRSARMIERLGVVLSYPDFAAGLRRME